MTTFKPRKKKAVEDIPQVSIPKVQINIIKSLVAAFMSNSNSDAEGVE